MTETATADQPKEYARFTMLLYYTHRYAQANQRQKQTFRDDITKLQYHNRSIDVRGQHSLAVLYRKFVELEAITATALFYDNSLAKDKQLVYKVVIRKGVHMEFENRLEDYYDRRTGLPHPENPFKKDL